MWRWRKAGAVAHAYCVITLCAACAAGSRTDGLNGDAGGVPADAGEGGAELDAAPPPEDSGGPPIDSGMNAPDAAEAVDAGAPIDAGPIVDLDLDGLDDAYEARIMEEYLPFRSLHADDGCPLSAIIYRLRPHPDAPATRLHAIVDVLFERDCGAGGHLGDDEVFGMTIDPSRPAPEGILALRAIAHQNTACQRVSDCGSCGGLTACTTAPRNGAQYPVVFYSKGKHGSYLDEHVCTGACFVTNFCQLAQASAEVPMFNAGEPAAPLMRDLTAAGVITSTAGWTEQALFHFDPWGPDDFGGAGKISGDLADDAFLTSACAP